MKIHLIRHAKTKQESTSGKDFDRELLPKGIKQAEELGRYLKNENLENTQVFVSSSKRTRQTFEIVNKFLFFKSVSFYDELYLCSEIDILKFVNSFNSNKDIVIIGHNNGISDFASYITGQFHEMKTCQYLLIDIPFESWNQLSFDTAKFIKTFRPEIV